MRKADLLDELQFGVLRQRGYRLGDPEHRADDIMRGISQFPDRLD